MAKFKYLKIGTPGRATMIEINVYSVKDKDTGKTEHWATLRTNLGTVHLGPLTPHEKGQLTKAGL